MAPDLVRVRPGPTATGWLLGRIREIQGGDPLSPVTVVLPTHHAGLHLRRRLAVEGYAGVRFTVLARLAESLAASRLAAAGRTPLTAVTRAALVRSALRAAGGPLAGGAEQAGLVDLVAELATDLRRRADPAADMARIRATGTGTSRAAVAAVAEYERRRVAAGLHDDVDVLDAASEAVRSPGAEAALGDLGAVIVHLPARLDPPEIRLLRELARRTPTLVALPDLGPTVMGAADLLGSSGPGAASVPPAAPPASIDALVAPDPVEEVRAAVREVLAAIERDDAVPLHRIAIVHRDEETYATLVRDALDEAGLPLAALDGRRLVDSVAARGLLGLIRLREQDLSRSAVLGWLSGLPHRVGVLRSQARWDQLSRDAGVVRGDAQWRDRLTALGRTRERTLARLEEDPEDPTVEAHLAALRRDIEDIPRIVEHVAAIDAATRPPEQPTWEAHVDWALRLRDEFLTPDEAWSAEDREASQAVEEVVRGLGAAQAVEPSVHVGVFLRALEDGLRARRRPEGRLGRGVLVGPHRLLLGMDVARVHVLGALEASFPPPAPVDPLLAGDPLGRRPQRQDEERCAWLAALAAADGGEVVVSAPVVDADGRAAYPSPWLLETLTGDGPRPRASEVRSGAAGHPRLRRLQTGGGVPAWPAPLSLAERREAESAAARDAGSDLLRTPLGRRDDLPLGRAVEVGRARRSARLTEFDGDLAAVAGLPLVARGLTGSPQSATGIETWATCPFRHLLGRVLTVSPTEDVDDHRWWQIDAAERGTLIHAILERFFREVAATGHPPPGTPYADEDVRHLEAIAEAAFREAEARGVVGHPLVWANERAAILADLRTVLRDDAEQRAAGGWRPVHLEQPFGIDGAPGSWPPVAVDLDPERRVLLRGYIDRVDVDAAGAVRVVDYKTGRNPRPVVGVESLLDAGRKLQLPVYGRAVRQQARAGGRAAPATTALYWYATVRGGFAQVGLEVDDGVEAVLAEVLAHIDAGLRAGCFPQVPGDFEEWWGRCENCAFCDYDTLCPAGRDVLATAKAGSPGLAAHRALRPAAVEGGA
jgi:ATP-dependent helicase/nuclease subunit B